MKANIRLRAWFVVSTLGWLLLSSSAQAASFDCTKAQGKVEHLICDSPELSQLDDELAAAYEEALQDPSNSKAIKRAQKLWLKQRNKCADTNCVNRAYIPRIESLRFSSPNASKHILPEMKPFKTAGTPYQVWQNFPYEPLSEICEEFSNMLNAFGWKEPRMRCEQKLHPAFTKFKPVEMQLLPSGDNFKYYSATRDLAVRETISRGYTPYPRQPGDLRKEFELHERAGGYNYYMATTGRFIEGKLITLLIQERRGDCRKEKHTNQRIAYEWDAATQGIIKEHFSFQSFFTFEGKSLQGDGLLTSYWNSAEISSKPPGKFGSIWVNQSDGKGAQSRICTIVFNGKQ